MKKMWIMVVAMFCLMVTALPAYSMTLSENSRNQVIFENKEILNLDVLLQRAKRGETDYKTAANKGVAINLNSQEEIEIPVFSTTQLLKIEKKGDKLVNTYATTSFIEISSVNFSLSKSTFDSTGYIRAYSTIHWTETYFAGLPYVDLTQITGGWERIGVGGSQIALSDRYVNLGQFGLRTNGFFGSYSKPFYPTANSYSYSRPTQFGSGWERVHLADNNSLLGNLGMTSHVRATLSGSSWMFYFDNHILPV